MSKSTSSSRNFRIPDELWDRAKAIADARYEKLSDIVRAAIAEYVRKHS